MISHRSLSVQRRVIVVSQTVVFHYVLLMALLIQTHSYFLAGYLFVVYCIYSSVSVLSVNVKSLERGAVRS